MVFLALAFFLVSSSAFSAGGTVSVMFYNVENLFDWTHAEGKNDWAFLPLNYPGKLDFCVTITDEFYRRRCFETDWNEEKFNIKLEQIKKVVTSGGYLPDILGLCEVENAFVVRKLAAHLGYSDFVFAEGPDPRGIDIALLYNKKNPVLRYLRHREYPVDLPRDLDPTRDILEVEFLFTPSREKLVVYVTHWPWQRQPSSARVQVAHMVAGLIRRQVARDPQVNAVVMGDFNVIDADHPHAFREVFDGYLHDARRGFLRREDVTPEDRRGMATGTYFYPPKMSWDNLDRIFYNQNLQNGSGLEVDVTSYKILSLPFLTTTFVYEALDEFLFGSVVKNVPNRYNFSASSHKDAGFSDHFAVAMRLELSSSTPVSRGEKTER